MAIYLWLEKLKIMNVYESNEDFQETLDNITEEAINYIQNQMGFKVMTEKNTPYWR